VITVCGSLTTWITANPSYCVYTIDKETLLPVKRETYAFDLEEANASGTPDWIKYSDWTQDYQMNDLSPSSYLQIANKIQADSDFAASYMQRATRNSSNYPTCDGAC